MKKDVRLAIAMMCLAGMTCACGSDGNSKDDTPVSGTVENTRDLCSDNLDNDGNGLKDCDDPGCRDFAFCDETEEGKENTLSACMDKADNDGDGLIDCDDSECQVFAICQEGEDENTPERCQDSKDNDKDGLIDCQDPNCQAFSFCDSGKEETKTENSPNDCLDGEDNDGDGKTDCCDEGCKVFAFCANACAEDAPELPTENTLDACTDGEDNDKDGLVDCLDPECHVHGICAELVGVAENTRELCSDGVDNDYNGVADKDDPNCKLFYIAGGKFGEGSVDLCKDGQDNDGDGAADCNDPECQVYDFCMPDYPKDKPENDKCPDDPFKFTEDKCKCGETLIGEDCYINVASVEDFDKMANSDKKYILKQNVDFGETKRAPIVGFNGVLDGGNKRISGVFNQNPIEEEEMLRRYCGLFGSIGASPVPETYFAFKNIDIAITLNCFNDLSGYGDGDKVGSLYVGALSARLFANAEHITGSSKVYAEDVIKSGHTYVPSSPFFREVGGLFGYVYTGKLSHIEVSGNVSAYFPLQSMKSTSSSYSLDVKVGGVAGVCGALNDVHVDNYMTLKRPRISYTKATYQLGGVCGELRLDPSYKTDIYVAENVSSRSVIKYLPMGTNEYNGGSYVGGVAGYVSIGGIIKNASFEGVIETNNMKGDHYNQSLYHNGLNVGGIAGAMTTLSSAEDRATGVDNSQTSATFRVVGNYSNIGGMVGKLTTAKHFVRNSSSNIDLELITPFNTALSQQPMGTYGGIVGYGKFDSVNYEDQTFIINNSARTNYIQTNHQFDVNAYEMKIAGIAGNGGVIVNNFVSDTLTCNGDCSYTPRAVGGSYVYESYWNKDVTGTDSGASVYTDASAEPYTYNLAGVPVTRTGKTVLGLLRYNAGHDGGVLSAHIPANIDGIYYNWTTLNDKDGHEIPVPADQ